MRLWSFIIVLASAIGLGVLIHKDPGYAFFAYGNWTVEMPLWITVTCIVLLIFLGVFFLWIFSGIFSTTMRVKSWWKRHQIHAAHLQTNRGLLEWVEGRFPQAERYLIQGASHNEMPLINYLTAAKAADESGASDRSHRYLQTALKLSTSNIAVRITQAELQLKHGHFETAMQIIQQLYLEAPKHPKIIRMLAKIYEMTNQWQELHELLPTLKKMQIFSKETLKNLEQKMYPKLLNFYAKQGPAALMTFWKEMPYSLQKDPALIYQYAKLLMQLSAHEEAEVLVRKSLKLSWNDALGYLYGLIEGPNGKKQLNFAESLVTENPQSAILLLTLGRICIRNQLWGKARSYLEQGLSLQPFAETYAELGKLMENLGEHEKRDEYFRQGLLAATQNNIRLQDVLNVNMDTHHDINANINSDFNAALNTSKNFAEPHHLQEQTATTSTLYLTHQNDE